MSNVYTQPSISGYNPSPPPNDGTGGSNNVVNWTGGTTGTRIKDDLADPLKAYVDAINTNVLAAFAKIFWNGITSVSATYALQTSDRGKLLTCSNTITINLLASATATSGFVIGLRNNGSGTVTVSPNGAETINGNASVTLTPGSTIILTNDGSNWFGFDPIPSLTGNNTFTGSNIYNRTAVKTASYVMGTGDFDQLFYFQTLSAPATFTLLGAVTSGAEVIVADIGDTANAVTIVPASGTLRIDAININVTSYTLSRGERIRCISDGANWTLISNQQRVSANPAGGDFGPGTYNANLYDAGKRVYSSSSIFESAELGIAATTNYTAAHGFAAVPKLTKAYLRCKTAELGFNIGDEIEAVSGMRDSTNNFPLGGGPYANSTNVGFTFGSSFFVLRPDTGANGGITLANWKIVLRAWK